MRYSEHRPGGGGSHEINVTPLIDVSLVLVVILLLATPLAFESSISLRQAEASARKASHETKQERVEIKILSDEALEVNRKHIDQESLEEVLTPLLANAGKTEIIVECADAVSHGRFVNILDRTKLCGARKIAVKE